MNFTSLSFAKKTGTFLMGVSVFAFLTAYEASAQQWETSDSVSAEEEAPMPAENVETPNVNARPDQIKGWGKSANGNTPEAVRAVQTPQMPTRQIQKKAVLTEVEQSKKDEGKIQIYMRDFKVMKTLAGITSCSMKFYVKSTLLRPVANISFRLKWPDLETPLSFSNIGAESSIFSTHSFAGDVCYTLDRTPNIIVNRCRAKGLTQQECASRIEWVK